MNGKGLIEQIRSEIIREAVEEEATGKALGASVSSKYEVVRLRQSYGVGTKETRNADFEKNIKEVSKKWVHSKETDSVGSKLRKVEQIFVPVYHGGHFKLVVVNMKTKKVEEWDTLKKTKKDKNLLRRVAVGLQEILEWDKDSLLNFKTSLVDVRQQSNGIDCGVFVCHSMEYPHQVSNKAYEWHSAEERYDLAVRILTAKENLNLPMLDTMSSSLADEEYYSHVDIENKDHVRKLNQMSANKGKTNEKENEEPTTGKENQDSVNKYPLALMKKEGHLIVVDNEAQGDDENAPRVRSSRNDRILAVAPNHDTLLSIEDVRTPPRCPTPLTHQNAVTYGTPQSNGNHPFTKIVTGHYLFTKRSEELPRCYTLL